MASGFPIDAGATVPKMRKVERSDFGARLRAARLDADVSQEDLAKAAGLAQSSVTELERSGQGSAAVTRMARKLNVDARWLVSKRNPCLVGHRVGVHCCVGRGQYAVGNPTRSTGRFWNRHRVASNPTGGYALVESMSRRL